MAHLIDKDALLAEIESRIKSMEECFNGKFPMSQSVKETEQDKGKLIAYKSILSFIDSLPSEEEPTLKDIMGKSGIGYCPTTGIGVKIMSRKECGWTESDKISDYDHKADVDAAMAELAEQCRKFTEEYKKSADDILAEMRGEEPVSNPIDFEQELYKAFGQVKDFTLGMRIAKRFYDMGKNSQEPVSEDLEEAIEDAMLDCNWRIDDVGDEVYEDAYNSIQMANMFKAGAKWQKQQDQSTIELAEDHAMLAGMEKMKEQMMAKAVDGKVIANGMGNPILHLWDKGRHLIGKKVKVIIIKEE